MNLKKSLTYIGFLAIGVLLFYSAFSIVDDKDALWDDMQSASGWSIAASFIMGYLAIVSRGLRWRVLLEPLNYSPHSFHSIHAVAFAYFANTFVPRSGELARCGALNQTDGIPVDQLFGTVISERVIDLVFLVLLMAVAIGGNLDAFSGLLLNVALPRGTGLLPFGVGSLVVIFGIWSFRKNLTKSHIVQKAVIFLSGVWRGLLSIRNVRRKGLFVAYTLFIWAMYFFMAWVIFKSIAGVADVTWIQAVFIMVAGGFGMVIPAPGGVGSYHWAVMLGFSALGYASDLGFAVANVIWMTQTVMIVTTGGVAYLALMWYRIRRDRATAMSLKEFVK